MSRLSPVSRQIILVLSRLYFISLRCVLSPILVSPNYTVKNLIFESKRLIINSLDFNGFQRIGGERLESIPILTCITEFYSYIPPYLYSTTHVTYFNVTITYMSWETKNKYIIGVVLTSVLTKSLNITVTPVRRVNKYTSVFILRSNFIGSTRPFPSRKLLFIHLFK